MKLTNLLAMSVAILTSSLVLSDETKSESESSVFKVKGVFEGTRMHELKTDTEKISSLKISRIVAHGSEVTKGQTIIGFETEGPDEQIKAARSALRLAKLTLDSDEFAFEQFQAKQELDRAAAERTWKAARQTYDNFQDVDRDRLVKSANFSLKSSQASLANAMEELTQLEQMYKEDELTEESEEIVLKRAKQAVESARFRLEGTKISTARALNQSIPAQATSQQDRFERAELAYRKSLSDLRFAQEKKKLEMVGKREAFAKKKEEFEELTAERKALTIVAPFDGIVFYGSLTRGELNDKQSTLKVGTKVTGSQVIATLVDPTRLQVRATLAAAGTTSPADVQVGQSVKISSNANGVEEIDGKVGSVSRFPFAKGRFDCVISVSGTDGVMPATSCTAVIDLGE